MIPSDSRFAPLDFALGLYESARRDDGREDGSLVFHASLSIRAAPRTPSGPDARFGTSAAGMAFAVR